MSINCSLCGFRNNEVKSVAGIADYGKRFTLLIADEEDMSRDLLKSDSARVSLPELELDTMSGTLGGRFTTVEGILGLIKDQVRSLTSCLLRDLSDFDLGVIESLFCLSLPFPVAFHNLVQHCNHLC